MLSFYQLISVEIASIICLKSRKSFYRSRLYLFDIIETYYFNQSGAYIMTILQVSESSCIMLQGKLEFYRNKTIDLVRTWIK